jgi:IPT/TIG domain
VLSKKVACSKTPPQYFSIKIINNLKIQYFTMTKYNQKYTAKVSMLLAFMGILLWTSCEKSKDTAPPTIEKLRLTLKDSAITAGGVGNTIAIVGTGLGSTQKVLFNDFSVAINPSYISDKAILVQLPRETPYRNQINKVKVITLYGEAIADFKVIQPEPTITSFAPNSGKKNDIVTITGKDLDDIKAVLIGADTCKVVAGGTDTQCKIIVPNDGSAGQITLITTGGKTVSSTSYGVSLILYDDNMNSNWDAYDSVATRDMASTEQFKRGKSIKMEFTSARGHFGAGTADAVDIKKYSALKVSIFVKGTAAETKLKIGIKGADGTTNRFSKIIILAPGWNDFTLDFATDLSKPDRFQEFRIEEWNNAVLPTIYIDDIGLL